MRGCPRRGERGQATVEFVLLIPVVVLLLLMVLQVALLARDRVFVSHAAQEAARVVSIDGDEPNAIAAARRVLPESTVQIERAGDDMLGVRVRLGVHVVIPLLGPWLGDAALEERVWARPWT